MATDNDTPFDAALAALDVEPTHHPDRMVTTYDILGLDAVRAAHRAEVDALRDKLTRVLGAIQRLQPTGSPIPGDEVVLAEWVVGEAVNARAAHRAEVERAVAEEGARCMADCDTVKARIPADAHDETAYAFRGGADACRAAIRARGAKS